TKKAGMVPASNHQGDSSGSGADAPETPGHPGAGQGGPDAQRLPGPRERSLGLDLARDGDESSAPPGAGIGCVARIHVCKVLVAGPRRDALLRCIHADNRTGRSARGHRCLSQEAARRPAMLRATVSIIGTKKLRLTRMAKAFIAVLRGAALTMGEL